MSEAAPLLFRGTETTERFAGPLRLGVLLIILLGLLLSPAGLRASEKSSNTPSSETEEASVSADASSNATKEHNSDPFEKFNRAVFWVNEKGDIYLVAPAAQVWRWVTPSFVRTAVFNVNRLITMPAVFANDLFQLKPKKAGDDFLRIVFNSSFGLAGLIDVATMVDIPLNDEDFGQTLGFWGVPPGPYLMLPLFGPATVRDGVGRVADTGATFYFSLLPFWGTVVIRGVDLINFRSRYLEEVKQSRAEAFDYYVFMREAYLQNRRAKLGRALGKEEQAEIDDDLYYFDDEEIEREDDDRKLEQKIEEDSTSSKADENSSDVREVAP